MAEQKEEQRFKDKLRRMQIPENELDDYELIRRKKTEFLEKHSGFALVRLCHAMKELPVFYATIEPKAFLTKKPVVTNGMFSRLFRVQINPVVCEYSRAGDCDLKAGETYILKEFKSMDAVRLGETSMMLTPDCIAEVNIFKKLQTNPFTSSLGIPTALFSGSKTFGLIMKDFGKDLYQVLLKIKMTGLLHVRKEWMRNILEIASFLREVKVMHRDIKPDNFCVQLQLCTSSSYVGSKLVLIDFGKAVIEQENVELDPNVFAPCYKAPEL